jgi:hypothetical protein
MLGQAGLERSAIWRFSSAMMLTVARVVAPNATATGPGALSCSVRSVARGVAVLMADYRLVRWPR